MELHRLKAQEYSKLESQVMEGSDDQELVLIQQELLESESLAAIKAQL